jgi:hypothetical protein
MTTKIKASAAILAAGLMTMAGPALAQQTVTPKSGPDINQPKYVPGTAGSTKGTGMGNTDNNLQGGGGNSGGSSGTSGAGSSSGGTGSSGGAGAGAGGSGSSGGSGGGSGSN